MTAKIARQQRAKVFAVLAAAFLSRAAGAMETPCWSIVKTLDGAHGYGPNTGVDGQKRELWSARSLNGRLVVIPPLTLNTGAPVVGDEFAANGQYPPTVAATGAGTAFIALTGSRAELKDVLMVLESDGHSLKMVGPPLGSTEAPDNFVRKWVIALTHDKRPVVAWEEYQGSHRLRVRVAQWTGAKWDEFPAIPVSSSSPFGPAMALDSHDAPWVVWDEGEHGGAVRIAKWDGAQWRKLAAPSSRDALKGIAMFWPGVVVLGENHAILSWHQHEPPSEAGLNTAEWVDGKWSSLQMPSHIEILGKSMLRSIDSSVYLAWNQRGAHRSAAVSIAKLAGQAWVPLINMFHVERDGEAGLSELFSLDKGVVTLVLDEGLPGRDSHLVVADLRACKPGEASAPVPRAGDPAMNWPRTVDEAAEELIGFLHDEDRARLLARGAPAGLIGTIVRNRFGLNQGNTLLLQSCGKVVIDTPEHCADVILERARSKLGSRE
jgi:hypothetical protein